MSDCNVIQDMEKRKAFSPAPYPSEIRVSYKTSAKIPIIS